MLRRRRAQSLAEYSMLTSIIVAAIVVVYPLVKRGHQSLIKVVSDQVGSQREAEQDFSRGSSYLACSETRYNSRIGDVVQEDGYIDGSGTAHFAYIRTYDQSTNTSSIEITNMEHDTQ